MRTVRVRPVPVFAAALALALVGCQRPPALAADGVSAHQFLDIPIPRGMRLRDRLHESDAREIGNYRYANYVYSGSMPLADVRAYMLERMPQERWELEANDTDHDGRQLLRFRRGLYVAECALSKQPDASSVMRIKIRTQRDPE